MKPIKLTVQAFGPFSGYQEIDFTKLGTAPLFLINGPTGSGKSSILDAICFALYGETTGSERTGDQMRCDHAQADCLTEVSFEFSLGDKHYKVVRSPDQQVPKKRGDGTTKKNHSAVLYQLQGEQEALLANKPTSVAKEVVNLIGLDVKQFRQVMVLPQGKFRELLIANSKEREQIFGQLFQTHIYVAIERALFEQAAGIRKSKDEFDNQIKGALDVANVASEEALNEQLQVLAPQLNVASDVQKSAQNALEIAQTALKTANELNIKFDRRNALQGQLNQHLSTQEEIEHLKQQRALGQRADSLNLPYREWQQACSDEKQAQQTLVEQQSKREQAKQNLDTQQKLTNQATQAAREIPTMTQSVFQLVEVEKHLHARDEHQTQLNAAMLQVTQIQQAISGLVEQQQTLSLEIENKHNEFQSANERCLELPLKQQWVTQLEQKIRIHHEIDQTQTAAQQFKLIEQDAERDMQLAKDKVVTAKHHADELEFHWHSSQAALLAKTLQHGEACPVCGSHDHPAPALFNGQEVSKEQVDHARQQQQQCVTKQDYVQAQWQKAQTDVVKVEQALLGWQAQLGDDTRSLVELQSELTTLQTEITQLNALKPEHLHQQLQARQQEFERLKPQQVSLEAQLSQAQQSAANMSGALNSLLSNIPPQYQQISQVKAEKQLLEQRIAQLQQAEQQAIGALDQAKSNYTMAESSVANAHERGEVTHQRTLKSHIQWEQARSESAFEDDLAFLAAKTTREQLLEWEQAINQFNERTSSLNGVLEALNEELRGLAVLNTDELQLAVTTQTQGYQNALSELTQLQSQVDNLFKVQQRLNDLYKRNEKLEQEYQVIGTLSDIANGRTGVKVSLHRFVLGVLLDDVLIQASQRLRVMSKGRYELRRKEDRAKGNAGSGLDLMVEDGYSGKLRDVATLSGGESFMAALALALGVSDVVQSYSGGIRLDTLFIDEGFGSLDPESLDLAIQTLIDLQQGGRTIGLISHVSELKEQMSLRLDVEASRNGSKIRVICP
ncbi:SMC family ATPase [Vibrio sinensis]|uniref:Nuclease SbcCD subunit C n=1 Tax=Vibrio sinensis TaxID=2302434 RepID=A0A3A6Q7I7_9VIBR|nr:SMC family ATPase [Vibrio sinensis]RJX67141.1 SMC family ATPase [Vibrio sinensis]